MASIHLVGLIVQAACSCACCVHVALLNQQWPAMCLLIELLHALQVLAEFQLVLGLCLGAHLVPAFCPLASTLLVNAAVWADDAVFWHGVPDSRHETVVLCVHSTSSV